MTSPGRSGRSPSGSRQTPDPNALKQKEIEAQLQFLKAKQVKHQKKFEFQNILTDFTFHKKMKRNVIVYCIHL